MIQSNIDISVLVPVYGVEKYIENSLRSIFSQSKTDGVEFVLVNDCTKDRSMEIARSVIAEFPSVEVKIVEHKVNRGIAAARQSALEAARGEYILFIDSDDYCENRMFEVLYKCAQENDADIVSCDFQRDTNGQIRVVREQISQDGFECASAMLKNNMHGMVWNKMFRRSLYLDNNITFTEGINLGEDLIFCLKIFCYAKKIVYLPEVLYTYVYTPQSITSNYEKDKLGDIVAYLSDIEAFYRERGFYERLERPLMHKKIIERLSLMKSTQGERRRKFAKLYPEAQSCVMECVAVPRYLRIMLIAAFYGIMLPFNAIIKLREYRTWR